MSLQTAARLGFKNFARIVQVKLFINDLEVGVYGLQENMDKEYLQDRTDL